jgi:hypothetical protein
MAINRDLSALPTASATRGGHPPDTKPRFVHVLVQAMQAANDEAGEKATAYDTRIRHSDAGKCARAVAYSAARIPRSNPMDLAGVWVTSLGTLIHEKWQGALQDLVEATDAVQDCGIEVKLRIDGLDASGHADAVIQEWPADESGDTNRGRRILFELKTVGGFSWKMKVGDRGEPEGPAYDHIVQAALNAKAIDADEMVIGYIATEAISKPAAKKKNLPELARFCGEWTFTRDEYEPIALLEQARLQGILDLLDKGRLAARKIPSPELPVGAEIVDPKTGRWQVSGPEGIVDTGTFWACGYCSWQDICAKTDSGRIPVESVPVPVKIGTAA